MKNNHLPSPPPNTPCLTKIISLGASGLQCTALACILSLALFTTATAVDFSGHLKDISITDSANINKAPVAAFTYAIDGDTVTFDGSGSTDPDGTITKYKWDCGNGTTSEGATASCAFTGAANLQVTLTVVDNHNGAGISQQTISPVPEGIADDFSTDTLANYTMLSGGLKIYNGSVQSSGAWTTTYAIHNKELASNNHCVEADVYTDGASATGGLMFRVDKVKKTGYLASFANGNVVLSSYSSGTKKWLASFPGKFMAGTYKFRVEISDNLIKIYVNGTLTLQSTSSTYTTGNSVGLYIEPYGKNTLITIDDLTGY